MRRPPSLPPRQRAKLPHLSYPDVRLHIPMTPPHRNEQVHAWGGGGGSGHYGGSKPYTRSKYHTATVGGQGAYVTGQINAKPGQKFQVVVGGAGEDGWTERRNENTFGGGGAYILYSGVYKYI